MSPRQQSTATKRQDAAFRAYVATGSVKGAAHRLGISERATRRHLTNYCEAHKYDTLVHAVLAFAQSGRMAG